MADASSDGVASPSVMAAMRVILTAVITTGLTHAAAKGWISTSEVAILAGALCTLALAAWGWTANSIASRARSIGAAGAMVTVPHTASDELKAVAADPMAPNVQMAR